MGSKTVVKEAPPAPTAQQSAQDVLQAQLATNPAAAKQSYDIAANPEYGIEPYTRLLEQTRASVLPQESAIRDQLLQNIMGNLLSPTGITPEQQQAISERRGLAQDELVQSMRTRANLGGGLYGGRSGRSEQRAVGELQGAFAEEDIAREERSRLNAIQAALPALSILFPEIGITAPQFESPAPSGNAALSTASASRGQDIQSAIAEAQMKAALQSSLYGGLGSAVGGFTGGSAFNNLLTR